MSEGLLNDYQNFMREHDMSKSAVLNYTRYARHIIGTLKRERIRLSEITQQTIELLRDRTGIESGAIKKFVYFLLSRRVLKNNPYREGVKRVEAKGKVGFDKALKEFERYNNRHNLSRRTLEGDIQNIKLFFRYLEREKVDDLRNVGKSLIGDYQKYLYYKRNKDGKPYAPATQVNRLGAVKRLFKALVEGNYLFHLL
ncbi:MAG: hypothetical protein AB1765_09110 [Candidatus Hydrogenedentota bacterium]